MWLVFAQAVCLLLVIEGFLPFLYPQRWRKAVEILASINDRQLRVMGFASMAIGAALLFFIK